MEKSTKAMGGAGGPMNAQAQALANRTEAIKTFYTVSVRHFGAQGDGRTNDDTARASAESKSSSVYWPEGTYLLDQAPDIEKSWGAGVCLVGDARVYLRPHPERATSIKAEAFGLPADHATDASGPLQRAIDLAQSLGLPVELPANAKLRLAKGLVFKHGQAASGDALTYLPRLISNGATLYPMPGVTAISIVPRCLLADASSNRGNARIEILGKLTFDGSLGDATSAALAIGKSGYFCSSLEWNRIDDILAAHFPSGSTVVTFTETRHYEINRLVIFSGGMRLQASAPGSFCGDMVFNTYEGQGSKTYPPLALVASGGAAGNPSMVRGIRFANGTVYGAGTVLLATGNSQLGDIWMSDIQFDSGASEKGECALEMVASGSGATLINVKVSSPYFAGYRAPAVFAHADNNATFMNVDVTDLYANTMFLGNYGDNNQNAAIVMLGIGGMNVSGGSMSSIHGDGASSCIVNVIGSKRIKVESLNVIGTDGVVDGVTIGKGDSDSYVITNNLMQVSDAVVNEYGSGSPNRIIANNMLVTA
ncbi:hypothetical protein WS68_00840 [Burkholderia sp. TSV86]|nr:hypothetical protein WS68_00840 [Burkholderia sp. TSV86]